MPITLTDDPSGAIPIIAVATRDFAAWKREQPPATGAWLDSIGFTGEAGKTALIPGAEGRLALVVQGVNKDEAIWALAGLPETLPEGSYRLDFDAETLFGAGGATRLALGWALGSYGFIRYKAAKRGFARLVWPEAADRGEVTLLADAMALTRDLVNTPAEDMGPAELAAAVDTIGARFGASIRHIVGDDLLTENYPTIHAVGRGSARAPRLIDLTWGDPGHPKLTLIGKGVCFDSGGLDIKSGAGMSLMKKDMGGSAVALSLAHMLMSAKIRAQLRVLVPAVENAISGNAYRPGDVLATRKGLTVEVNNTDAEGRLVLCDALAYADAERPDLIIDFATLTGAARVALGPELPALFGNDERVVQELARVAAAEHDPLWPMPLWAGYEDELASKIADLSNVASSTLAGAIFGALFLKRFVTESPWVHIDLYAWNSKDRPGRGVGAEAQALRGTYRYLVERYGIA
jgi:leucyl aminopeptidase